MSKYEIDRMDDEGAHQGHAEREKVAKRRFEKAAARFARGVEEHKWELAGGPTSAWDHMMDAYKWWKHLS